MIIKKSRLMHETKFHLALVHLDDGIHRKNFYDRASCIMCFHELVSVQNLNEREGKKEKCARVIVAALYVSAHAAGLQSFAGQESAIDVRLRLSLPRHGYLALSI